MEEAVLISPARAKKEFVKHIEEEIGTEISQCYQCGKCSAGCPFAFAMDYTPRQVIRMLQWEMVDEALRVNSIWICATCNTCTARCPRGVDISSLMDVLRREAIKQGINSDQRVSVFNDLFLKLVEKYGRIHEMSLMIGYNFKTKQPFKDYELGLPMLKRGKLHLLPKKIKAADKVKEIFKRVREMEVEER